MPSQNAPSSFSKLTCSSKIPLCLSVPLWLNLKKEPKENGNIAFYLAFVLPITLCLLIIVIDVSEWQFLRQEAQREADKIALEVAPYLSSKARAQAVFLTRANEFNQRSSNLKISLQTLNVSLDSNGNPINPFLTANDIQVSVTGQKESIVDTLLAAVTGNEVTFPVNQTASARLVPYDFMIIFSDAISMRPQALTTWGDPINWPQSDYFLQISKPTISVRPPPVPPRAWPDWWQTPVFTNIDFQRWSTQLCYNPVTLPLKRGLLMLIDAISISDQNRIGVYSSPGDIFQSAGFSSIKEMSYVRDNLSPVRWSNYFEPDVPNCDEACLLYSSAVLGLSRYPIPDNQSSWGASPTCTQVIVF